MLRLTQTGLTIAPSARVLRAEEYSAIAEASAIVRHAHAEAAAILEKARSEAAGLAEESRAEYDRRHQEGHRAGMEEGKAEISQQIVECMTQSATYFSKVEGVMVELVMRALRRVLGTFDQRDIVADVCRQALATTRNEGHVTIRVAPAQAEHLQSQVATMLEALPKIQFLEILPDERLAEDACILETEIAVVDASIQTQLRAIEKALINALK